MWRPLVYSVRYARAQASASRGPRVGKAGWASLDERFPGRSDGDEEAGVEDSGPRIDGKDHLLGEVGVIHDEVQLGIGQHHLGSRLIRWSGGRGGDEGVGQLRWYRSRQSLFPALLKSSVRLRQAAQPGKHLEPVQTLLVRTLVEGLRHRLAPPQLLHALLCGRQLIGQQLPQPCSPVTTPVTAAMGTSKARRPRMRRNRSEASGPYRRCPPELRSNIGSRPLSE